VSCAVTANALAVEASVRVNKTSQNVYHFIPFDSVFIRIADDNISAFYCCNIYEESKRANHRIDEEELCESTFDIWDPTKG